LFSCCLNSRASLTNQNNPVRAIAFQLFISQPPGSAIACISGIAAGQLYRSDLVDLKSYRLSHSLMELCARLLSPLVGSSRAPRRSNRALPGDRPALSSEIITTRTAHRPSPSSSSNPVPVQEAVTQTSDVATAVSVSNGSDGPAVTGNQASMMSQWVQELAGTGQGMRVPSETEITTVLSMFPDARRADVVSALQRRCALSFSLTWGRLD